MDEINVNRNFKSEVKSNNGDVLPENKLRQVVEPKVLVHHHRDAELDRLLDDERNRKMTEKGKAVSTSCLGEKASKAGSQNNQKSSEIDDLMNSHQNSITVKE